MIGVISPAIFGVFAPIGNVDLHLARQHQLELIGLVENAQIFFIHHRKKKDLKKNWYLPNKGRVKVPHSDSEYPAEL